MSSIPKLWLISPFLSYYCLFSPITQAQVIPDGTTTTDLTGDCLARCDIEGGIRAGSNLFHSFQEFNIDRGGSVYFADPGVANIFTRVTGGNSSEIFGKLGVAGDANFWLINPQGILFGSGASLDINGSFVATTADRIVFGDRGFFSANPDSQENLPLLTVNPSAFFAHQMSRGSGIAIKDTSLTIPTKESLILIGRENNESTDAVLIESATISAPQGKIQIGAVANRETIEITPDLQLQFSENILSGNITLTQGSEVDVSGVGAGSVTVRAAELNIQENSLIRSVTLGNIDSGDIRITTQQLNLDRGLIYSLTSGLGKSADIAIDTESLTILGNGVTEFQTLINRAITGDLNPGTRVAGITNSTSNLGLAGKIYISSNNISITEGSVVGSIAYGEGKGSELKITATETLELSTSGLLSLSAVNSRGDTGNLNIKAQKLIVRDGSVISAATLGQGTGGDIEIQATELVELSSTPANSLIPTTIFTNSIFPNSGKAGNLAIDTNNLIVRDGAQLSSASGLLTSQGIVPFGGDGGDINIRATESITISGGSANGLFPSSILSDTRSNSPAGNINIDTGKFVLEGQALVSASSIGTGDGGNLTINATESIYLDSQRLDGFSELLSINASNPEISLTLINGGFFSFNVGDGNGGDINLETPILSLSNGALITTATNGMGNGGNINIETSETVEIITSLIATSSAYTGDSGNLTLHTSNLIIKNGANLATATVGLGKAGDMTINATDSVELSNSDDFVLPIQGGILTNNSGDGLGRAGNLQLDTKNLIIRDGLSLNIANVASFPTATAANNLSSNNIDAKNVDLGNSIINATESIEISGSSVNGEFISSINSTTNKDVSAGNLQINTPQLTVSDGANISVNSIGSGAAGRLDIVTDNIYLENGGTLNASTLSGKGGNINLQLTDILQMSDRSMITTNAFNVGDGGNIDIDAKFVIAFPDSSITANAIAGKGGNIEIETQDIFVASTNQISATSELGINGKVKISSFTSDVRNNLTKLPEQISTQETRIISSCGVGNELGKSSFVYTGKGALPPSPLEGTMETEAFLVDWGSETSQLQIHPLDNANRNEIIEATKLSISDRGNPILTATKPSQNLKPYDFTECPFKKQLTK